MRSRRAHSRVRAQLQRSRNVQPRRRCAAGGGAADAPPPCRLCMSQGVAVRVGRSELRSTRDSRRLPQRLFGAGHLRHAPGPPPRGQRRLGTARPLRVPLWLQRERLLGRVGVPRAVQRARRLRRRPVRVRARVEGHRVPGAALRRRLQRPRRVPPADGAGRAWHLPLRGWLGGDGVRRVATTLPQRMLRTRRVRRGAVCVRERLCGRRLRGAQGGGARREPRSRARRALMRPPPLRRPWRVRPRPRRRHRALRVLRWVRRPALSVHVDGRPVL